ncbi:MAG: Rrf2 family transcriptional regulator [Myxococcota bacterium]
MQLTDRTDLALRLLLYLAVHDDVRVSVAVIAQAYSASEAHLAKVAQALVHAGFLDSAPGRGGGVRLTRPAAEIRVGAVVRALEPTALVACFIPDVGCPVAGPCGLQPALRAARDAFLGVLDGVTLADAAAQRPALRQRLGLGPEESGILRVAE